MHQVVLFVFLYCLILLNEESLQKFQKSMIYEGCSISNVSRLVIFLRSTIELWKLVVWYNHDLGTWMHVLRQMCYLVAMWRLPRQHEVAFSGAAV